MAFRSTIRQRKYDYLIGAGFYPAEATELSRTSRKGMSAPYFRRLIRSRRRTVENLTNAGYTDRQIRNFIKDVYVKNGWLKRDSLGRVRIDVWQFLRDQEDKAHRRGEEYESPWKKRTKKRSSTKKEKKRVTRKDMLQSLIKKLENRIAKTANENRRLQLEEQRFGYEQQLRKLD